jgi:hypothetical protein
MKRKITEEYKKLSGGLEVIHKSSGAKNTFVLWDSEILKNSILDYFKKEIHEIQQGEKQININTVVDWAFHYFEEHKTYMNFIIGTIVTKKLDKAWEAHEVQTSAAEKGYGPLMYDLALSQCETITSDRSSVSSQAEGIWAYYFLKRKDVEKLPFDDIKNPKTPPIEDDAKLHSQFKAPLNYAYRVKNPIYNVSMLDQKSNQALQKLLLDLIDDIHEIIQSYPEYKDMSIKPYEKYQYLKTMLIDISEYYFAEKYG